MSPALDAVDEFRKDGPAARRFGGAAFGVFRHNIQTPLLARARRTPSWSSMDCACLSSLLLLLRA